MNLSSWNIISGTTGKHRLSHLITHWIFWRAMINVHHECLGSFQWWSCLYYENAAGALLPCAGLRRIHKMQRSSVLACRLCVIVMALFQTGRAAKTLTDGDEPSNPLPCSCSDVDPRSYFTKVRTSHLLQGCTCSRLPSSFALTTHEMNSGKWHSMRFLYIYVRIHVPGRFCCVRLFSIHLRTCISMMSACGMAFSYH